MVGCSKRFCCGSRNDHAGLKSTSDCRGFFFCLEGQALALDVVDFGEYRTPRRLPTTLDVFDHGFDGPRYELIFGKLFEWM
jgi:hypothetical protein